MQLADFSGLILGQVQKLEEFHVQGLVVFSVQGPQGLVGCCTLTQDQAQGLGQFQAPDPRTKSRSQV